MPARSNKFQRLIALLNATQAEKARITESAMLKDKVTGESREVDILLNITTAANYEISIGIEVVSRSRPAGTPWIEEMCAKHANLPVDKLVLVSEKGFTKPAIIKAKFYDIETISIDQALAADWSLLVKLGTQCIFEVTKLHFDCTAVCSYPDGSRELITAPLQAPLQVGDCTLTVGDLAQTLLNYPQFRDTLAPIMRDHNERELWLRFTDSNGIWKLEDEGGRTRIEEMRIGLRVLRTESAVEISTGSYKETPFVAGNAAANEPPLQFVLTRQQDGTERGLLLDSTGFQILSPEHNA